MTQWDFQNKGKSGWTGKSSFVLEVPLRHLRPSVIYSVPCDWILQRAYRVLSVLTSKPFDGTSNGRNCYGAWRRRLSFGSFQRGLENRERTEK